MNEYQKEYIHRINKVIDYIEANISEPPDIGTLAGVAGFSPFHFHRIFSAFTGETLIGFVKRMRLEKAASLLINMPEMSIGEIASSTGFSSMEVFCRNFKGYFGLSAKQFRINKLENDPVLLLQFSKNRQTDSKDHQMTATGSGYFCDISQKKFETMKNLNVEIKEMPAMDLIYVRHTGAFDQIGPAFEKLFRWAGPRGLLRFPQTKAVTVYHDDPKVTDRGKIRQSACITVTEKVKTEGEIGNMKLPSGKYAVGHFEIDEKGFQEAWDGMCLWVAESGYQPADALPYELYHNNHNEHPEKKFIVDICIPVKPL